MVPVLRNVTVDGDSTRTITFADPFYAKVKSTDLRRLTVFIKDSELKPVHVRTQRSILRSTPAKNMGSIEVFEFKQRKWIPYVPDFEKWQKHFWDIHEGRVKPDCKERYIVGSGSRENAVVKNDRSKVEVKLVTPVAQALEMAKSELAREEAHKKANEPTKSEKEKIAIHTL